MSLISHKEIGRVGRVRRGCYEGTAVVEFRLNVTESHQIEASSTVGQVADRGLISDSGQFSTKNFLRLTLNFRGKISQPWAHRNQSNITYSCFLRPKKTTRSDSIHRHHPHQGTQTHNPDDKPNRYHAVFDARSAQFNRE